MPSPPMATPPGAKRLSESDKQLCCDHLASDVMVNAPVGDRLFLIASACKRPVLRSPVCHGINHGAGLASVLAAVFAHCAVAPKLVVAGVASGAAHSWPSGSGMRPEVRPDMMLSIAVRVRSSPW
mmetsp:Transcript_27477/g.59764  ORF Transcript_27477/g.59764 Transcript_27477/m.59764 type:complete len:125 (+) Transcript_27477:97-471(+)